MRQNFKRNKMQKEESRRKKQEEKRNRRLHKNDPPGAPAPESQDGTTETPLSPPEAV